MSEEFEIRTPIGGFSSKSTGYKVKEGDKLILRYWSWRKFGFIRKLLTIKKDSVEVEIL